MTIILVLSLIPPLLRPLAGSVRAVVVPLHPHRRDPHVRLPIARDPELLEDEGSVLVVELVERQRRDLRGLCHGAGPDGVVLGGPVIVR